VSKPKKNNTRQNAKAQGGGKPQALLEILGIGESESDLETWIIDPSLPSIRFNLTEWKKAKQNKKGA
jgi:hypothetical protein